MQCNLKHSATEWTKHCILFFSQKSDLRITQNYSVIAANVYNSLFSQLYLTQNQENSLEKSEQLSDESLHNLKDSDNLSLRSMKKVNSINLYYSKLTRLK